jgi:hypothetical protein
MLHTQQLTYIKIAYIYKGHCTDIKLAFTALQHSKKYYYLQL